MRGGGTPALVHFIRAREGEGWGRPSTRPLADLVGSMLAVGLCQHGHTELRAGSCLGRPWP